jgi:enoyl-[acyl-carrier protein] reductase/trans-2-enoyl-CoA reductase (NAD+)
MDGNNFTQVGDYKGYKNEFLHLNGFGFDNVNYQEFFDIEALKKLKP